MVRFNIGCNFDDRLLDGICAINQGSSERRITGFYGAVRAHAFLSARPAYRLPDVSVEDLQRFVAKAKDAGIDFTYCLNTLYPGSKREVLAITPAAKDLVQRLIDIGIARITIATPLVADLVRSVSSDVQIQVSTIAHIDTITQIKLWKDHYGIVSVCGNLLKNRSIAFLRSAQNFCRNNGIRYEVMVNEFCVAGVQAPGSAATHCIYRDSCYLCHAENSSLEDDSLLEGYPMSRCMESRTQPSTWLKAQFVRPEDIVRYAALGIEDFKITGRTGSTEYLLAMAKAYLNGTWRGNLLSLWKNLETIATAESELVFQPRFYIDNSRLDGFVGWWFDDEKRECANEVCGETCSYCDDFFVHVADGST